jgi:hypothetical protein
MTLSDPLVGVESEMHSDFAWPLDWRRNRDAVNLLGSLVAIDDADGEFQYVGPVG